MNPTEKRRKEVSIHSREQNYDKRQQKPDHVQGSRVGLSTLFNTLYSQTQYDSIAYFHVILVCLVVLSGGFINLFATTVKTELCLSGGGAAYVSEWLEVLSECRKMAF